MIENDALPPAESPDLTSVTALANRLREEVSKVVFGQDETVVQVVAALLAGGHVLLEGKPGLGKTHMVLALASTFGGNFGRIQFTPDMMPSDITGFTLFDMKSQTFKTRRGPVFTNLLLADEINRAPAKTQAALLEVMQEQQVTIDGESLSVAPPFMCFATQNPIEQEGTYPLPEAQLDRFLVKVVIDYPSLEDERRVVSEVTAQAGGKGVDPRQVEQVCNSEIIIEAQRLTAQAKVVPEVIDYALRMTRHTREAPGLSLGAGTRGAISLVQLAKAYAVIEGRDYVTPDDIKRAAIPVFRHRVHVAPEVAISGQRVDDLLIQALESVEAPRN
jgi:MoxR-like ATPase|tara:strand:+ start:3301 stop:4296 length:996 start_codon:yes stop_codon:yes gene_type:complete